MCLTKQESVYRSTQLLTWIFIPLLQGYVDSGDFSVASKWVFSTSHALCPSATAFILIGKIMC